MATVQQIIDFLNRKYPSHGESNANIILDLEDLHQDIYMRLERLSNKYDIYEMETVANQLYYTLPADFDIEDIEILKVSTDSTGAYFDEYSYRGPKDSKIYGNYWGRGADGTIYVMKDEKAITTSSLKIHLYYFAKPTTITLVTQTPDLDADYHDLLKFGIVQAMASQGDNPDDYTANYWQAKFDEKMARVEKDISAKMLKANLRMPQVKERW